MNRRTFLKALPASVGFAASWRVGYAGGSAPQQFTIPAGADARIPPLPIPPVTEIAPDGDVRRVVDYYHAHEASLIELFQDTDRTKALFAQYIVATAIPYGVASMVYTLAEFVKLTRAHCGDCLHAQAEIATALGLTVRPLEFVSGWHGWIEVLVHDIYELFDGTSNTWIDQPMSALLAGAPRQYRYFYSPIFDPQAPDVFRAHLREGYSVPILRAREPYLGLEVGTEFPTIEPAAMTAPSTPAASAS